MWSLGPDVERARGIFSVLLFPQRDFFWGKLTQLLVIIYGDGKEPITKNRFLERAPEDMKK